MNNLLIFITAILASYGAVELLVMAAHADKERRPFVILQIACGFGLCVWVIVDKSLISWPVFIALLFIASDRLQTRIMNSKHRG